MKKTAKHIYSNYYCLIYLFSGWFTCSETISLKIYLFWLGNLDNYFKFQMGNKLTRIVNTF